MDATSPDHELDWVTDFDHAHPSYNRDAPAIWQLLRQQCPIAHTDRYGGAWLPVRHHDIETITRDTTRFSSVGVVVSNIARDDDFFSEAPLGVAPPITSDPPAHHPMRRLLLPAFSPHAVAQLEPAIRTHCRNLLDNIDAELDANGNIVDVADMYTKHIPVQVIAHILGFPPSDGDLFRGFVHDVLEAVDIDPMQRISRLEELGNYIAAQVEHRRDHPSNTLVDTLLASTLDDEPLTLEQIVGVVILLLVAGIDTTWSAIGSGLWHLATHPDDLARLVDTPDLWPTAIEELLRAYAPVTMARVVTQTTIVGDVTMNAGDWVLLPFPAANRDPSVFPDADTVHIDRVENRHAAFGLGIHRCLGSNLARLEMTVALQEFVTRHPHFTLTEPDLVEWSVGQVRGPRRLPLHLTPQRLPR